MSLGLNFKNFQSLINPILIGDPVATSGGSVDSLPTLTTNQSAAVSAALELQCTDGGLLFPRMTGAQMSNLNAVPGLTVFNTSIGGLQTCTVASPASTGGGTWDSFILQAGVTVSQAGILAMYGAPVNIIPVPTIAGYSNYVLNATFIYEFNTTVFANGGPVLLQWGNAVHGAGTNSVANTVPAAFINNGASQAITETGLTHADITGTANLGLYLSNTTGAFTGGNANSFLTVIVTYFQGPGV